jgi:hypothetical protein
MYLSWNLLAQESFGTVGPSDHCRGIHAACLSISWEDDVSNAEIHCTACFPCYSKAVMGCDGVPKEEWELLSP